MARIKSAHFSPHEGKNDLPTLKVLRWDNLDTSLHLDHVAELMIERLAWPDDEEEAESWRMQWRSAFTLVHREVINISKKLSVELARLARDIHARINTPRHRNRGRTRLQAHGRLQAGPRPRPR